MENTEFWAKLRKHWLALAVILAVLILSTVVNDTDNGYQPFLKRVGYDLGIAPAGRIAAAELSYDTGSYDGRIAPDYYGNGFAPEIEERQIERDAYFSLEIRRGKFEKVQDNLKSLIKATDSLLLYENINQYDDTYYGSYTIKVKADSYDLFLLQARELGKVLSFTDSARDITGQLSYLREQMELTKTELNRLKELLKTTLKETERIKLQQQISDQERNLNDLQNQLENQQNRVEYFTVVLNMQEVSSSYVRIELIDLSELVRKLVLSFNALVGWLFGVTPWALLGWLVWAVLKRFNKS